jgi:sulfatase maturation enzyme AslB (radical SAM superfamily)
MEIPTIDKAIAFFFPHLASDCTINFYGGEPLLAWDKIKYTVNRIQQHPLKHHKNIQYSISTNGSLLDEHMLRFLDQHHFSVLLSFDGLAQDITKNEGSFDRIISSLKNLLESRNIYLETNSVFTPETLRYLTESVLFIRKQGVENIGIGFSRIFPWGESALEGFKLELERMRDFLLVLFKKTKDIPLLNFRPGSRAGPIICDAGRDRLSLTPDENLWGCNLFFDYFKEKKEDPARQQYCFGNLDSFIANHEVAYPVTLSHYSNLRIDKFFTPTQPCHQCEEMNECEVCPVDNLFLGSAIDCIPSWACRMKRLYLEEKKLFLDEIIQEKKS